MGGDHQTMSFNARNDRGKEGRDVFVSGQGGSGNMFVSVRGGGRGTGGPPHPLYRNRGHMDNNSWRGGRGRSRLPEGHWRGGGGHGGSSSSSSSSGANIRGGRDYYRGGPGGRRPPPPSYDDLMRPNRGDIKDRQQYRAEMWCRGGRGGRMSRRGAGSKFSLDRRNQFQATSDWMKFTIHDCAQHEPAKVMEEVTSMVGDNFPYHLLATEGNNITFYVEDGQFISKSLLELSKRLAMPGSNQRLTISKENVNNPPIQPPTEDNLAKVKMVLAERYNESIKQINLSEFHKDRAFRDAGLLFPLYVPSNLASVGRLIVANIPHVENIDLTSNKLIRLDSIAEHLKACPKLNTINLTDNKLASIAHLQKLKGLPLEDLYLQTNPLRKRFKSIEMYMSEVRGLFPKLKYLDGEELPKPIGFEVDDVEVVTPPFRPSFFCDERAKDMVVNFLKQYYDVFDGGDRSTLSAAYCEDVIFSSTTVLPETTSRPINDVERLPNRNLKLRQLVDDRIDLLYRGRRDVIELLNKLPASKHDLHTFVVDVPIAKPQLLKVVVSGVYRLEGVKSSGSKSSITRAFQRSLIIVPEGTGFCIANEQLYVTHATAEQMKEAFKSTAAPIPIAAAVIAAGSSGGSTVVPKVAGGLEPLQLQMIEQFCAQSSMLPEFSKLCLEQNSWNFERAASQFIQLKNEGKIPPEYFGTQ